jgi:predicted HTH domain antitoxin
MKENVLTIKYSDDVLLSLKETKNDFEKEARYLLALKLYELGKISSGKAAKLAGLNRVNFLMRLSKYKVSPFQVDLDEIVKESRDE